MQIANAFDERRKVTVNQVRVIRDHALEQVARHVRHALTDATEPDNADGHLGRTATLAI